MRFAPSARLLPALAVVFVLGQGAFGQTDEAKLGGPVVAQAAKVQPDPGTLFAYSDQIGTTLQFSVVGSSFGSVWGDGVYTSDSVLAAAAVHAGLLAEGQSGTVTVEVIEGLDAYDGVERNGIESRPYASWNASFRFVGVAGIAARQLSPDPGDLSAHRGADGMVLTFMVTGDAGGAVWGDGIYTDDSRLAAAAVHAGVLQVGQTGPVRVEILPGQQSYGGSERNGVTSKDYANWSGSFRIIPLSSKAESKLAP